MALGQLFGGLWFIVLGGLGLLYCLKEDKLPRFDGLYTRQDEPVSYWGGVVAFGVLTIAGLALIFTSLAHLFGLK